VPALRQRLPAAGQRPEDAGMRRRLPALCGILRPDGRRGRSRPVENKTLTNEGGDMEMLNLLAEKLAGLVATKQPEAVGAAR